MSNSSNENNNENKRMLFWVISVLIIGSMPIILRLLFYNIIPITDSNAKMITSLDITFAGLAFNWSNINESLNITLSKKRKKLSNTTAVTYLLLSAVLVLFLGSMLGVIIYVDISKYTQEETIEKNCLLVTGLLAIASLVINYTLIKKLKSADL